jgi:Zn-dependent protease with chaperone function
LPVLARCSLAAAASLGLAAVLVGLYRWLLGSRSLGEAWRRGRVLLASSVSGMLLLGLLGAPFSVETAVLALPLVVVTQAMIAQFFDRRIVGEALYGFEGRLYRVRIIEASAPTAFAVAARGRVYASRRLYELLSPGEAAAVVAHEVGHGEALRPVPPALGLAVVAVAAAQAAEAVLYLAAGGCPVAALLVAAAVAAAWGLYSWAWEHLADTYSAAVASWDSYTALARITGAVEARPPGPLGLLRLVYRSLRPRRGPGRTGLLVNPHPPPGLRLWLLRRILSGGAPGAETN